MFDYDRAMADEKSRIFTNIHTNNVEEVEDPLKDWQEKTIDEEDRVYIVRLKKIGNINVDRPFHKILVSYLATDENLIDLFDEKDPYGYDFWDMDIVQGKDLME